MIHRVSAGTEVGSPSRISLGTSWVKPRTQIYGGSNLGLPTMDFGEYKEIFELTQARATKIHIAS